MSHLPGPGAESCRCQNCEWTGTVGSCDPIKDIYSRVAPGEPMPAGQCPECGCLCQPTEEVLSASVKAKALIADLVHEMYFDEKLRCLRRDKEIDVEPFMRFLRKLIRSSGFEPKME